MTNLEVFFYQFRKNTIGYYKEVTTCYGRKRLIYADWTASGRLYRPIENKLINTFGPYVGNTHSESSITGSTMTKAYSLARKKIKAHVNADDNDILIITGFGMTSAVNKLQRILGLKSQSKGFYCSLFNNSTRPLVIVTHMEHHSNYISWLECDVDLVILPPDENGLIDLNIMESILMKFSNRPYKIGAFTACSNVTGIITPYHEMAQLMHKYNGLCFIDFCACAPYTKIDMHPIDPMKRIDGIYFSPHKFLGGPGTPGILVFNADLYNNYVPDNPGGGTLLWSNPWGEFSYLDDIETIEDGGTPGFLQTIKAALSLELKDKLNIGNMAKREQELTCLLLSGLSKIDKVHILQENITNRLGIVSFYVEDMHYNLMVKILNDHYGIQTRGGCSCAGPYGHYLLGINKAYSERIATELERGNLYVKPGWIRISIHPIMTNSEIIYIVNAISDIVANLKLFEKDYIYDERNNEFRSRGQIDNYNHLNEWFKI